MRLKHGMILVTILRLSEKIDHYLRRILIKKPHGISETNMQEFYAFSKKRWLKEFDQAGFEIIAVKKGPAASGNALGMDRIRKIVEKLGFTSEYIYIAKKKNSNSSYINYFSTALN